MQRILSADTNFFLNTVYSKQRLLPTQQWCENAPFLTWL